MNPLTLSFRNRLFNRATNGRARALVGLLALAALLGTSGCTTTMRNDFSRGWQGSTSLQANFMSVDAREDADRAARLRGLAEAMKGTLSAEEFHRAVQMY